MSVSVTRVLSGACHGQQIDLVGQLIAKLHPDLDSEVGATVSLGFVHTLLFPAADDMRAFLT